MIEFNNIAALSVLDFIIYQNVPIVQASVMDASLRYWSGPTRVVKQPGGEWLLVMKGNDDTEQTFTVTLSDLDSVVFQRGSRFNLFFDLRDNGRRKDVDA